MDYYVYALLDPRKEHEEFGYLPFYIGKGKNNRAFRHLTVPNYGIKSNPGKVYKINSIRRDGYEPICIKIKENLSEKEAYDLEDQYILKYGRKGYEEYGVLTNICIDHRPPSRKGQPLSENQKEILKKAAREKRIGKTYEEIYGPERAEIVRQNVGNATKRRAGNISEETRRKLSISNSRSYIEIYGSEEEAKKQAEIRSRALKGQKRTPEQRKKMSENNGCRGKIPHNAQKITINGLTFPSQQKAITELKLTVDNVRLLVAKNGGKLNIETDKIEITPYIKNKIEKALAEYKSNNLPEESELNDGADLEYLASLESIVEEDI